MVTWITGIVTILFVIIAAKEIDWEKVSAIPSGPWQAVIGALVMLMTGFGLGWINIAADWSRYQRRDAKGSAIVAWNTFGGAIAPVLLVLFGLLLAGSDDAVRDGIAGDPIGALAQVLPDAATLQLPHVGHWPQLEDPEGFDAALLDFLARRRWLH